MKEFYTGKRILVTGGTGSIGSEIVKQLIAMEPEVLRIFSRDETRQYELKQELGERSDVRWLIGDVRDEPRLRRAMEGIDIVFHAAALKHVPSCEYNPFEAVKTNVVGTQNVISAALDARVQKVVAISTDKAVNPINVMGATKLLAEKLIVTANNWIRDVRFACVRFGNVLGSRGSVVPTVIRQLERGGPVTMTHPQMTRFMMTIHEAVDLCLEAGIACEGGEVFILKMPALEIIDLFRVIIEEFAPRYGLNPDDVFGMAIPIRAGEKMHELLLDEEEAYYTEELERMFVVRPHSNRPWDEPVKQRVTKEQYHSDYAEHLDREGIRKMLRDAGVL